MMKLLLIVVLFAVLFTGQRKLGPLVRTIRRLPDDYRRGKEQAEDPAAAAKDVTPRK